MSIVKMTFKRFLESNGDTSDEIVLNKPRESINPLNKLQNIRYAIITTPINQRLQF